MMSIICVYNNKNILENNLIKSLNMQNQEYELILVDNRDKKFNSASSALNYGAEKARGEYFVFAHQDIYFSQKDWLKKTYSQLKSLENVGIAGVAGKSGDSIVRSNIKHGTNLDEVSPFKIKTPLIASTLDECLFIVPKEVFDSNYLDEKNCDNWHLYAVDYVYSIKEKGFEAYLLPSDLEHRSKGASMSEGYYDTLSKLQKKFFKRGLIRTCMGDWFTFVPISIQRYIKKFKNY